MFTAFVVLLPVVNQYNRGPGWIKNELPAFQSQIAELRTIGQTIFPGYQASSIATQKWHLLDHIIEGIKHVGGVQYLHERLYESSHRVIETAYRETSRRKRFATDKAFMRQNETLEIDRCSNVLKTLNGRRDCL